MNSKVTPLYGSSRLLNYKVHFIGENEALRREIFEQFTRAGLGSTIEVDADEITIKNAPPEESVLVLAIKDSEQLAKLIQTANSHRFQNAQIILLDDSSSVVSRIIAKSIGCSAATYSIERTPSGPVVKLPDLVVLAESCVDNALFPIFNLELEAVRQNGFLHVMEKITGVKQDIVIEHALITYQIATTLSLRPGEVKKAVRLSFYCELALNKVFSASAGAFLKESKHLWPISDSFHKLSHAKDEISIFQEASRLERVSLLARTVEQLIKDSSPAAVDMLPIWGAIPLEERIALKAAAKQTIESRAKLKTTGAKSA